MRLLQGLKIRGKLIASFGLAMVLVLSALGTVTYLTFADSLLTSQARIAGLHAKLAQRVVEDALPLIESDRQGQDPVCHATGSPCADEPVAARPELAREILALGLPDAVSLLLSSKAGHWLILKPGVVDAADLQQAFARASARAEIAATARTEPPLVREGRHYLLTTRLARPEWQLHYAVPEALYRTDLVELKNRVIAATVVVLWASVWIVLIIAQRLALPVRNLSAVMASAEQRIEETPAVLLARGDEIGELARSFEALAARIRSLIHVDPLTQLFNRRYVTQVLDERLAEAVRHRRSLVCLILDVDFFKSVNDGYGHPCGDQALIHCATVIRAALLAGEVLARYGGEEFMIILPQGDADHGARRADSFRQRLEQQPLQWEGQALSLTISVGVGWMTDAVREAAGLSNERAMAQLIEEADQALYEAKRRGRNRTLVWRAETARYETVQAPAREAAPLSVARLRTGREADQRVERTEA